MKRILLSAASLGLVIGFGSCERHEWKDTKVLSEPHGAHGSHDDHGHGDAHGAHGEKGHDAHGHDDKAKDAHGH